MKLSAQTRWSKFDQLMNEASYKSAYELAEQSMASSHTSADRLATAYHLALAASHYQEDAYDSAKARYRALLPQLDPLERALCYSFLHEHDSALVDEALLMSTPVEAIADYCNGGKTLNVTTTAYDVLSIRAQNYYEGSSPQRCVELQRKLVQLHEADEVEVRLWHELRLLELLDAVPNRPLTDAQIEEVIDRYRSSHSPYLTHLYSLMAQRCNGREAYVDALRWCDSALLLDKKSEGGVACANLRNDILAPRIQFATSGFTFAPELASLQQVSYRNVEKLWLRIVPYKENLINARERKALLATKPLHQWTQPLMANAEHRYEQGVVSLPPLKAGHYLLLASPSANFKSSDVVSFEMNVTEMLLVQRGSEGLLLNRTTGLPIAGQTLTLEHRLRNDATQVIETVVTNSDGRYRFATEQWGYSYAVVAERNGYRMATPYRAHTSSLQSEEMAECEVRTDRPIYRPGDTVQVALLLYHTDGLEASVDVGERVAVRLYDPNGSLIDSCNRMTDDFGVAYTTFFLPHDRLSGQYQLRVEGQGVHTSFTTIRVEEYKQPKFMVTLDATADRSPAFGQPMTIAGLAASYSAVPISGARVQYTVVRRQLGHWWWRWWGVVNEEQVAQGEAITGGDGAFCVVFTPEPDSNIDLSEKPTFEYEVRADVADINGESHFATAVVRVGYRNAFLSLEEGCTMDSLCVHYRDINGNPLSGKPSVKVELLQQPDQPRLDHTLLTVGVHNMVEKDAFGKLFPHLAYDASYNDMSRWHGTETSEYSHSGVYRITLSAPDADTVVEYITHTPIGARKVNSQKLLWAEVDRTSATVGEEVNLRLGSRFHGVEVYYSLRVGNEERDFRRLTLNDELRNISIGVDSAMLGGFKVELFAVMDGIEEHYVQEVVVPFVHKRLRVEVSTFRDKLLPGEQEEWVLTVQGQQKEPETAALMLTMYDDALNSYGADHSWGFSPWRINYSPSWSVLYIYNSQVLWQESEKHISYTGSYPTVWHLKEGLFEYYRPEYYRPMFSSSIRLAKNSRVANASMVSDAIDEDVLMDEAPMMEAQMEEEEVSAAGSMDAREHEVQVRTNLSTLAFFAPNLRTDADGRVTYRFTVPELLTRWNVRGLAFTRDVKIGTVDKNLITQKQLMVQPNMPRFLRSGDNLNMMLKVVNLTDAHREVEVSFLLTDAATDAIVCQHQETIGIGAGESKPVQFEVQVPQDVYVATYRIVAKDGNISDGEQGQLPVVSNRQTATVSQALYINGAGEKYYTMPEWLKPSDTRQPQLVAAEVTSNPLWLAVKVMPYMSDLANPSTPYLAHQLYVNTIGSRILGQWGDSVFVAKLGEHATSRLHMNVDVKQTLLQTSPWVRAAENEEEQMANLRHYMDSDALRSQFAAICRQLSERQGADGGWSWLPEGESSLWITQGVLRNVHVCRQQLSQQVESALAYVDREQQRYYERHIKPYLKKGYHWNPTDIDYLFTRSFYGKASTEAYRYYYASALKEYPHFTNLYTQAQLALIFYRHGNHKQALDLLRRLKEKSLQSDEMGVYWRDNLSGWWWYSRPIETQALLIEAFAEITPTDHAFIGGMQQWLLKQKQTTHWGNSSATTEAIRALSINADAHDTVAVPVSLKLFGETMEAPAYGMEGYRSQRWNGSSLDSLRAAANDTIVLSKADDGIAWGAVYYQFTDDMDCLPTSEMGISVRRSYAVVGGGDVPKVGDRVKVRIDLQCDRALDYLEIIDGRPACFEPLSTRAGWRWNDGLSYYIAVNNTDTRCYVEHQDKGKYWFEYEVYVTNPGQFMSGPVIVQCMYAPEFRALAPAVVLSVDK